MEALFSPHGGIQQRICAELRLAKTEICVMAYSLTAQAIITTLLAMKNKGVALNIVLDRSHLQPISPAARQFHDAQVNCRIDEKHQIAHNKVIIIDNKKLITGSYNFTSQAENGNAENILIVPYHDVIGKYRANFTVHFEHSEPLDGFFVNELKLLRAQKEVFQLA